MNELWVIIAGAYMLLMSLVLFIVMGADKRLAIKKRRRVPEKSLFLLAALGGGLGGVAGMAVFRHKTQHTSFKAGMPLLLLLNLAVLAAIAFLL